jgi:hypothetical protein
MKTTEKLDLCKVHRAEYATPKQPVLLQTEPAQYLSIEGQGAPGGECFTACIGALYAVAFTIKMRRKFAGKQDYSVCKLEAQWCFESDLGKTPKNQWKWKLLIRTPGFVNEVDRKQALEKLLNKGKSRTVEDVKLETIDEGRCVQMRHVGPYDREPETIELMRGFAESQGLTLTGPHHEIYLSDPRRVPPERLKTILRQPVVQAL